MLSLGGVIAPTLAKMRQSQDARQTDNRGAAIVFRLETSALLGARRLAREGNRPDFSSVNLKPMGLGVRRLYGRHSPWAKAEPDGIQADGWTVAGRLG